MTAARPVRRIIVALPAYNEEANIGELLRAIHRTLQSAGLPHCILVVDDGSRDRTPDILRACAQNLPLAVETHAANQGLGGTLRDLLRMASSHAAPGDLIVTMDSDESHSPDLIPAMVARIGEGCDVVVASRFRPGARIHGLAPHRVWASRFGSLLLRAMFPTPGLRDFTCGFRVYRAEALELAYRHYGDALVDQPGFSCMVDVLLKMRRLPLVFGEVPMILRYDLKRSRSKMRLMRTSLATLRLMFRRRVGW